MFLQGFCFNQTMDKVFSASTSRMRCGEANGLQKYAIQLEERRTTPTTLLSNARMESIQSFVSQLPLRKKLQFQFRSIPWGGPIRGTTFIQLVAFV